MLVLKIVTVSKKAGPPAIKLMLEASQLVPHWIGPIAVVVRLAEITASVLPTSKVTATAVTRMLMAD